MKSELVRRLGLPVSSSLKCGQWIHRSGNDFDMVVIEEFPPERSRSKSFVRWWTLSPYGPPSPRSPRDLS